MSSIVACVECGAKNRLKPAPDGRVPACGKCGASLPWISQGSDANFSDELRSPVPVLVDFWAPWCGPCHMVAPVLEELSKEQRGKLKIVKLNIDENQQTSGRFRVMSIPTLILFQDGEPQETMVGALPKQALMQKLQPHL